VSAASDMENEYFHEDPIVAAQRIVKENAPFAAQAIASLATDDTVSPSVRLNAAKYLVDRNLGPVGLPDKADELDDFLRELQGMANGERPHN
jgi:hypothetical protein